MMGMWKRESLFSRGSTNATSFASGVGFGCVLSTAPIPLNLVFRLTAKDILYVLLSQSASVIFSCDVIMLKYEK